MNPGTWMPTQRTRRLSQTHSAQMPGRDVSSSFMAVLMRTLVLLIGLLLAIALLGSIDAAAADALDSGKSMRPEPADATQSEFERLMAIAHMTRQGTNSKVRRLEIDGRPALGAEDAPLVLVEVASFECPYCRRHWLDTMPALQQRYVETGQIRYVFIDVVIDPRQEHAQTATEAAHCANEQGRYVAFRDQIFRNQKAISAVFLEDHAQAAGLDLSEFRRCMAGRRYRMQVENDMALARKLRIRGTPSFFWARAESGRTNVRPIRRVSGIRSIEEFAQAFDALHKHNAVAAAADSQR